MVAAGGAGGAIAGEAGSGPVVNATAGGGAGSSAAGSAAVDDSAAGATGAGTAGVTGEAGAAGSAGAAAGASGSSAADAQALPPITDYAQPGPFATTMEASSGPGGKYTIFRPDPLGADGFVHSPLIFGPGIITTPAQYRTLLTHLASHGFVTICANSLTGGPNAVGNLTAMREGLEWLIAQNEAAGMFQGKLAVDRAVTMGYSIGATASTQLSSHEAILTTISIHGHNTSGDPHGPILLLTGTSDVIADNRTTLATLAEAPAMLAALPIGHLEVLGELSATGRYVAPITAWLRYWVNGDDAAKSFFWGASCEMCGSPWIEPETNAAWDAQTL
jgi:dienelactone hydrolase